MDMQLKLDGLANDNAQLRRERKRIESKIQHIQG